MKAKCKPNINIILNIKMYIKNISNKTITIIQKNITN